MHHRSVGIAGRHSINGDAMGRTFQRKGLGEDDDACLGCGVIGLSELTGLPIHGANIDNAAEIACPHAFDDGATHIEDPR